MDHDLQAAIDASLRDAVRSQTSLQRRKSSVVDLTGDSDGDASAARRAGKAAEEEAGDDGYDAELKRAIQLSLQSGRAPEHETIDVDTLEAGKATATPEPKRAASTWIAGFDRKKMEEERLARLAKKRKTGEDGSALALPAGRPLKASRREPPSGTSSSSAKISSIPLATATVAAESVPRVPSTEPTIQFPEGAVKKTWAFRCERKDDIKLEEVLQPSDLELAVLSSFLWDMDWLLMKFTNPSTRFLFIMGAKGEERVSKPAVELTFLNTLTDTTNCAASTAAAGDCIDVEDTVVFPADGRGGELHALQADAAFPCQTPAHCDTQREPGPLRLGRERRRDGECKQGEVYLSLYLLFLRSIGYRVVPPQRTEHLLMLIFFLFFRF
ncbi:uncharacterized protein ARB_04125 [Trichophyton benhamiae CBS 112371]|uniref:Uncharacterized protein n=1 Tax=Arthroderma benhamiae (strain ATCC MYA-4681 / CBS 112371) TaxID=663331 RepID=D4AIN0_ARTBC|nr:uncharacterized protein ARB_04125 [Trichophyton benhamiae CBS 112371]EFE36603.1 hypothetical protein ARB_04125 [Trichophyton benhamiae CBS 112371]